MRNQVYTKYGAFELQLGRHREGGYQLISRNNIRPDSSFELALGTDDVYVKKVESDAIDNAFSVETFAQFSGYKWQVDRSEHGKLRLSIGHEVPVPNLKMVDRGWYEIWVDKNEIEKIWEERTKSGYDFPYPDGLPGYQELDVRTL